MKILAIETSGIGGSVALESDGTVTSRSVGETREQTARVLPMIDELLADAGCGLQALDAIAFGQGPGSFTGLRVAAAITQGLALATGIPVVAVSSMAGLLQQVWRRHRVNAALVCLDARMDEVYFGHYVIDGGVARLVGAEALGPPTAVAAPAGAYAAVGDGFARYPDVLAGITAAAGTVLGDVQPLAVDLLPLAVAGHAAGRHVAPVDALPVYLRDSDAWQRR